MSFKNEQGGTKRWSAEAMLHENLSCGRKSWPPTYAVLSRNQLCRKLRALIVWFSWPPTYTVLSRNHLCCELCTGFSSEIFVWDFHLRFSSEIFVWDFCLRFLSEIFVWDFRLRFSSQIFVLRFLSKIFVWNFRLRFSFWDYRLRRCCRSRRCSAPWWLVAKIRRRKKYY